MRLETGNLDSENETHPERKGWIIGDLVPETSLRHADHCSVKWVTHPKGLKKASGTGLDADTKTTVVLRSGRWLTRFMDDGSEIVLSDPGDYLTYEGAALHENEALEESHLIVFRWTDRH